MNRKEAAELSPFIKAFGEGKDIEMRSKNPHAQLNGWAKMDEFIFGNFEYRIKPEPKYRPFKDAEECWAEMQNHQPFGWVTFDCGTKRRNISSLLFRDTLGNEWIELSNGEWLSPYKMFKTMKFIDGSPFGVKVED